MEAKKEASLYNTRLDLGNWLVVEGRTSRHWYLQTFQALFTACC